VCGTLVYRKVEYTEEDDRFLKSIQSDKKFPAVMRAEAAIARGRVHHEQKGDIVNGWRYFREGQEIIDNASEKETRRNHLVYNVDLRGYEFQKIQDRMANLVWHASFHRIGFCARLDEFKCTYGGMDPSAFLQEMEAPSGNECDYCHKPQSDVTLRTCGQCLLYFYCSRECQRKDWKSSHKKWCRKSDGKFKAGDFVLVNDLSAVRDFVSQFLGSSEADMERMIKNSTVYFTFEVRCPTAGRDGCYDLQRIAAPQTAPVVSVPRKNLILRRHPKIAR